MMGIETFDQENIIIIMTIFIVPVSTTWWRSWHFYIIVQVPILKSSSS